MNEVVNMKCERMRASIVPCRFWNRCGCRDLVVTLLVIDSMHVGDAERGASAFAAALVPGRWTERPGRGSIKSSDVALVSA